MSGDDDLRALVVAGDVGNLRNRITPYTKGDVTACQAPWGSCCLPSGHSLAPSGVLLKVLSSTS